MKNTQKIAFAVTMGLATISLVGCSVANEQESMGQYVDGSVVTTRVKAKIADQMGAGDAANINVETIRGGVVQLSGFAKSEAERARAGNLARSVPGVTSVHNSLLIQP